MNWEIVIGTIAASLSVLPILISLLNRRRAMSRAYLSLREALRPKERKGLLLLVGANEATASQSIEYHLPRLQHCWLISLPEASKTVDSLTNRYGDQLKIHRYLVSPDEVHSTYEIVLRIFDSDVPAVGLQRDEIIADITGGTKAMAVGMALACVACDVAMQHMRILRDESGAPIGWTVAEPIMIDIADIAFASRLTRAEKHK